MDKKKYLLGCDIGSSSVKVSVLDSDNGIVAGSASSPKQEMDIISSRSDWAEQDPELWWFHLKTAAKELITKLDLSGEQIISIGISYQMHGLVVVNKKREVIRPSIIWCDSRAVEIGNNAFQAIGPGRCLSHFLNSPGNFTASKLKWVQENEPSVYEQIYKVMLPGDYIAMKMTDQIYTTVSGLSEGILWDYQKQAVADILLKHYGIPADLLPEVCDNFSIQGELTSAAAGELGLRKGIPVAYRAGDQPNNAFSLNVLKPGEAATTAGTSGVIYGVIDQARHDVKSRVNTFVHVNHRAEAPSYGVLLCINGTGILNRWLKQNLGYSSGLGSELSYMQINEMASRSPVGSGGITILPFGNGSERILENGNPGASVNGLNFNQHTVSHLLRAAQEGIVFSMMYGMQIMKEMGLHIDTVKAGHTNMFLSPIFREAFVNTTGTRLELYNTDGSQGAARGAGFGSGYYKTMDEAFTGLKKIDVIEPETGKQAHYQQAYERWLLHLHYTIKQSK
ncbi:MAG: carbohydrate kinase [Rhodothermaceae bacterium]|nr:carbohydrate kinase [Rhodothermaceae bacterium]